MAEKKKTIREELLAKIKKCSLISVNGAVYFGEKTKKDEDGIIKIINAVVAGDTVEETVKAWLKANNLGNLEEIEISGDGSTFVNKKFTEDQQDELEIIVISFARVAANAVNELINSKV